MGNITHSSRAAPVAAPEPSSRWSDRDFANAQERVRLSEQRYKSLTEVAREIILVVEYDGTITLANPAALHAVGIPRLTNGWKHIDYWVCRDDRAIIHDAIELSLSGIVTDSTIEVSMCTTFTTPKPVELSIVANPRSDQTPEFLLIGRDISEHKQNESRLRDERSRLQQVLESANAFIAFFDAKGRYTLINERYARALGYEPEQVIGKTPEEIIPEELSASIRPRMRSVLKGNQVAFEEELAMPGLPDSRWYSGTHNPIFDSRGHVTAFVTVILDITEQKLANENRIEKERLDIARKLARTIAHEFRQPLTALRLISELSRVNGSKTEFLERNFDKIPELVDRLDDLVSRLLYITNLQSKPYLHDMDILDLEGQDKKGGRK